MFFNCIKVTAKCLYRANQLNINNFTPVVRIEKYCAWHHRRPVKIVNEEEILQHAEEAKGPNEFFDNEKEENIKPTRIPLKMNPKPKQFKKKIKVNPNDSKFREDGSLNIIELKENDKTLINLMMSVRSKKQRNKNSRIILEGSRLINDAIDSGAIPEIIVFSRAPDVMELSLPEKGVKLFKVPYRSIQTWSTLVTPPGLMGFFKIPDVETRKPAPDALPLTIICDNVRDPGNMGSILRAAAAVGCKKLITLIGCVDIWDPKVLKSAAGCHFRMPIFSSKTWDDIHKLIDPLANIFVADNNTLLMTEPNNKADDESSDIIKHPDVDCETDLKVEPIENITEADEEIEESEESEEFEEVKMEQVEKRKSNYQRLQESKVAKELTSNIPVIPYYSTDYTENENIIIIGGETLGLSIEALNMVNKNYGIRVNIPMTNGVDSLNTGMALGIIAFEIRRQHAILNDKKE